MLSDACALEAAISLQMLAPQIPLMFMGEESASVTPFLFFSDHHDALADAVREGRRREFEKFAAFADPARRERIPDPNAPSGDGAILTIAANLGGEPVRLDPPRARALFESATGAAAGAQNGSLVARSTVAFLETAA